MSTVLVLNDQPNSALGGEYATPDDVQKQFASEITDLFLLALLLTADAEKAELCIVRSIHECLERDPILKGWLRPWIRNTVIRNGIGIVKGIQGDSLSDTSQPEPIPSAHVLPQSAPGTWEYSAGNLELNDFDRLAYVICVLEHYSSLHCALLVGRSRQEVRDSRNRALAQIAAFESKCCPVPHDSFPRPSSQSNDQPSTFDGSCGCLLD
jgi:hypothetical protein